MPLDGPLTQNKQHSQVDQFPNEQPACQPIGLNEVAETKQEERNRVTKFQPLRFSMPQVPPHDQHTEDTPATSFKQVEAVLPDKIA